MVQKPEIQYVGQFYIHGSEAKKLAKKNEQKKTRTELPLHRVEQIRKVQVDPLAIGSLLVAAVLLVAMVLGTLSVQTAWTQLHTAEQYVFELQSKNTVLSAQYHSSYDLEEIRSAALALGMIPAEEAQTIKLNVTMPEQQPQRTWKDDLVWFLEGLFA